MTTLVTIKLTNLATGEERELSLTMREGQSLLVSPMSVSFVDNSPGSQGRKQPSIDNEGIIQAETHPKKAESKAKPKPVYLVDTPMPSEDPPSGYSWIMSESRTGIQSWFAGRYVQSRAVAVVRCYPGGTSPCRCATCSTQGRDPATYRRYVWLQSLSSRCYLYRSSGLRFKHECSVRCN